MQVEEADHLQNLISAAHASNLDFYYALSPGLDIAYSNSKEVHDYFLLLLRLLIGLVIGCHLEEEA